MPMMCYWLVSRGYDDEKVTDDPLLRPVEAGAIWWRSPEGGHKQIVCDRSQNKMSRPVASTVPVACRCARAWSHWSPPFRSTALSWTMSGSRAATTPTRRRSCASKGAGIEEVLGLGWHRDCGCHCVVEWRGSG